MTHTNHTLGELLAQTTVIPVMVVKDLDDAVPMAKDLVSKGFNTLEITLRTECGILAIAEIAREMPEVIAGAGTVTNKCQYEAVVVAGAKFVVSPGHTDDLLDAADNSEVPFLPGVATPSEAMKLADRGYQYFKLFPAEAVGGIPLLKSIMGPLPHLRFCPTGGINEKTSHDYLALSNVVCVGGSWMV